MTPRYHLLNEDLLGEIEGLDRNEQANWLFLEPSAEFRGRWAVDSLWPDFFFDFEDIVGSFKTVAPARLDEFLERVKEGGYQAVFVDPPESILDEYEHLKDPPPFDIESSMEGTVKGMLPWQIVGFNKLVRDESLNAGIVCWDTGPQPLDAAVLTPTGWTTMGDLSVGDLVIGSNGRSCKVTGVYPQGEQEVFRLTFKDGSQAYSTGNHLWGFYDHVGRYYVRRLDEYQESGLYHKRGDVKWFVDRVSPVQFEKKELPVDPYLLGVILGDGSLTNSVPQIYSHEGEIIPHVERVISKNARISQYGPKHYAIVEDRDLNKALRDLGLWNKKADTKFIPDMYKYTSVEGRIAILQGLLDTDGSAEKESARLFTTSYQLAQDVIEIVRGLGGRAKLGYKPPRQSEIKGRIYKCKEGWTVSLVLPLYMEYFRLERKRVERRINIGRNSLRAISSIGIRDVQCISVDSIDERYVTQDYVITHNTGKTVFIASALLWHWEHGSPFDLALVVVKANNKADMNRKLKRHAGLDSTIIDGTAKRRKKLYEEIEERIQSGEKVIGVTNYEKFREDRDYFKSLFNKRRVLIFWDEMPTRLSNRDSQLYKAVKGSLYQRFEAKDIGLNGATPRPSWLRQWELSATPIENSPEGQFNCIRLMNPPLLGSVREFYAEYTSYFNPFSKKPEAWQHLDKMEAKIEHMTHRVSRDDAGVGSMFPQVVEDSIVIDWHPKDRAIYNVLTGKAKDILEADFSEANILALIQVMQMLCDAPSMLVKSVENRTLYDAYLEELEENPDLPDFDGPTGSTVAQDLLRVLKSSPTDQYHTKMETLREILIEKHPEDKALIFMTWSSYGMEPLTKKLDEWGVTYVTYEGTQKQADAAKDRFREDPDIRVFLSSDRGADSIDLPEAAIGINYNLPWTWVRKRQRMRNVRVDSKLAVNYWYDLVMADSIEERKQEIIHTKEGFHKALFDGKALEDYKSSKMTREDLLYILLGS